MPEEEAMDWLMSNGGFLDVDRCCQEHHRTTWVSLINQGRLEQVTLYGEHGIAYFHAIAKEVPVPPWQRIAQRFNGLMANAAKESGCPDDVPF